MVLQKQIILKNYDRGYHLITSDISKAVSEWGNVNGILNIFVQHTSAGVTINENADPTVRQDFEQFFKHLVPETFPYHHAMEGVDDMPAHIKASIIGQSVSVPVSKGRLLLGTWQGIYFCEFRNKRSYRNIILTLTH